MMDDQLDNDLRNRIKEVFENFEDPSADEGWLELRKKFPAAQSNRRALAWIWWGAVAALLLMFMSIGIWMYNDHAEIKKLATKPSAKTETEKIASTQQQGGDTINKGYIPEAKNTVASSKPAAAKKPAQTPVLTQNNNMSLAQIPKPALRVTAVQPNVNATHVADSTKTITGITSAQQLAAAATKSNGTNAQQDRVNQQITDVNPVPATSTPPARTMASVFADEKKMNDQKAVEKPKNIDKRVRFGVYATTYFNYAKGSNNEVNVGAGFSSDIAITRNLKIVTGVSIGQNTLNYNGAPPTNGYFAVASTNYNAVGTTGPSAPGPGNSGNAIAAAATSSSLKSYNANLVGLDIPLNLKFEFNPQKNDTYISLGVSSGTFINEVYTSQFNNVTLFNSLASQTSSTQTSTSSFNGFYFAKTLNVAFGVGYPLGKNHLVIEPFLKYPLEGLGAQQLRFGAGGLNLKFSFQSQKK